MSIRATGLPLPQLIAAVGRPDDSHSGATDFIALLASSHVGAKQAAQFRSADRSVSSCERLEFTEPRPGGPLGQWKLAAKEAVRAYAAQNSISHFSELIAQTATVISFVQLFVILVQPSVAKFRVGG